MLFLSLWLFSIRSISLQILSKLIHSNVNITYTEQRNAIEIVAKGCDRIKSNLHVIVDVFVFMFTRQYLYIAIYHKLAKKNIRDDNKDIAITISIRIISFNLIDIFTQLKCVLSRSLNLRRYVSIYFNVNVFEIFLVCSYFLLFALQLYIKILSVPFAFNVLSASL